MPSSPSAFCLFLAKSVPSAAFLNSLFLWPRMLFPQTFAWLAPPGHLFPLEVSPQRDLYWSLQLGNTLPLTVTLDQMTMPSFLSFKVLTRFESNYFSCLLSVFSLLDISSVTSKTFLPYSLCILRECRFLVCNRSWIKCRRMKARMDLVHLPCLMLGPLYHSLATPNFAIVPPPWDEEKGLLYHRHVVKAYQGDGKPKSFCFYTLLN